MRFYKLAVLILLFLVGNNSYFVSAEAILDPSFIPNSNAAFKGKGISAVAYLSDGSILIGGDFQQINGIAKNYLAKLDANGDVDLDFPIHEPSSVVNSILVYGDESHFLIGGDFSFVGGVDVGAFTRMDMQGKLSPLSKASYVQNGVHNAIFLENGKIGIVGRFAGVGLDQGSVDPQIKTYAILNQEGDLDLSVDYNTGAQFFGMEGTIFDLVQMNNGNLLFVGLFDEFSGSKQAGIVEVALDGVPVERAVPFTDNITTFNTVTKTSEGIFIAGDGLFTKFQDNSVSGIVKLTLEGKYDPTFKALLGDGAIYEIIEYQDKILVLGSFSKINSQTTGCIAVLNSDGSIDDKYLSLGFGATDTNSEVIMLDGAIQDDGKIILVGRADLYDGKAVSRIVRFNGEPVVPKTNLNELSVYFENELNTSIDRLDLANGKTTTIFSNAFKVGRKMTADTLRGYLYWIDEGQNDILRGDLEKGVVDNGGIGPNINDIEFDYTNNSLLWIDDFSLWYSGDFGMSGSTIGSSSGGTDFAVDPKANIFFVANGNVITKNDYSTGDLIDSRSMGVDVAVVEVDVNQKWLFVATPLQILVLDYDFSLIRKISLPGAKPVSMDLDLVKKQIYVMNTAGELLTSNYTATTAVLQGTYKGQYFTLGKKSSSFLPKVIANDVPLSGQFPAKEGGEVELFSFALSAQYDQSTLSKITIPTTGTFSALDFQGGTVYLKYTNFSGGYNFATEISNATFLGAGSDIVFSNMDLPLYIGNEGYFHVYAYTNSGILGKNIQLNHDLGLTIETNDPSDFDKSLLSPGFNHIVQYCDPFLVTTTNMSGTNACGELDNAVNVANQTPGRDTIRFSSSVASSDFQFTQPIEILQDIVFEGGNYHDVRFWGNDTNIVNVLYPGVNVEFSGISFRSGLTSGTGGAIDYNSSGNLTLKNCLFENNISYIGGGAVRFNGNDIYIDSCVFLENKLFGVALYGGAVYVEKATKVYVGNSNFDQNKANSSALLSEGGAIYIGENLGNTLIENSTFHLNYTHSKGAAISYSPLVEIGNLTVVNSTFYENHLTYSNGVGGSAIFSLGTCNIYSCTFANNWVSFGGKADGTLYFEKESNIQNTAFAGNLKEFNDSLIVAKAKVNSIGGNYFEGFNKVSPQLVLDFSDQTNPSALDYLDLFEDFESVDDLHGVLRPFPTLINRGVVSSYGQSKDQLGNPRVINVTDIGAVESSRLGVYSKFNYFYATAYDDYVDLHFQTQNPAIDIVIGLDSVIVDTISGAANTYRFSKLTQNRLYSFSGASVTFEDFATYDYAVPVLESGSSLVMSTSSSLEINGMKGHVFTDFSVQFWVKIDTLFTDYLSPYQVILTQGGVENSKSFEFIYNTALSQNEGTISLNRIDGEEGVFPQIVSNKELNDGRFHHIVGSRSNGELRLYIDGNLDGKILDNSADDLGSSNNLSFYLGDNDASMSFHGEIDELVFWNRSLTESEIPAFRDVPLKDHVDALAIYHFDGQTMFVEETDDESQEFERPLAPTVLYNYFDATKNAFDAFGNNSILTSSTAMYPFMPNAQMSIEDSSVVFSWNAPVELDLDRYEIFKSDASTGIPALVSPTKINDTTYSVEIENGLGYDFWIVPIDKVGQRGDSAMFKVETLLITGISSDTLANGDYLELFVNTSLDLSTVVTEEMYKIEGGVATLFDVLNTEEIQNLSAISILQRPAGTYAIRLISPFGKSDFSPEFVILPSPLSILYAEPSSQQVTLHWETVVDVDKYKVEYYLKNDSNTTQFIEVTDTFVIIPNLTNDSIYTFMVSFTLNSGLISENSSKEYSIPTLESGSSYLFDGNASVELPLLYYKFDDFTTSAWVKADTGLFDSTIPYDVIIEKGLTFSNQINFSLSYRNAMFDDQFGKVSCLVSPGSEGRIELVSNQSIRDGKFHHLVCLKRGANLELYIDGFLDTATSIATDSYSIYGEVYIGNNENGSAAFHGEIDEIALWSRGLRANEIEQIRDTPVQISDSITGIWHFDGMAEIKVPEQEGENRPLATPPPPTKPQSRIVAFDDGPYNYDGVVRGATLLSSRAMFPYQTDSVAIQALDSAAFFAWGKAVELDFLKYEIYAYKSGVGGGLVATILDQNDTSIIVRDLDNGFEYSFVVFATDKSNQSGDADSITRPYIVSGAVGTTTLLAGDSTTISFSVSDTLPLVEYFVEMYAFGADTIFVDTVGQSNLLDIIQIYLPDTLVPGKYGFRIVSDFAFGNFSDSIIHIEVPNVEVLYAFADSASIEINWVAPVYSDSIEIYIDGTFDTIVVSTDSPIQFNFPNDITKSVQLVNVFNGQRSALSKIEYVTPVIEAGKAVLLTADQYIQVPPSINNATDWTFTTWFKGNGIIYSEGDNEIDFKIEITQNNAFSIYAYNRKNISDTMWFTTRDSIVSEDEWNFVGISVANATVGSGQLSLVINDESFTGNLQIVDSLLSKNYALIGADFSVELGVNSNSFQGQMDELSVWATAKSIDELKALRDQDIRGSEQHLLALYHFDEFGFVHDASPFGKDGISNNTMISQQSYAMYPKPVTNFVTKNGDKKTLLQWNAGYEKDLFSYRIYSQKDDLGYTFLDEISPTDTSYLVAGIENGVAYSYYIQVLDKAQQFVDSTMLLQSYLVTELVTDTSLFPSEGSYVHFSHFPNTHTDLTYIEISNLGGSFISRDTIGVSTNTLVDSAAFILPDNLLPGKYFVRAVSSHAIGSKSLNSIIVKTAFPVNLVAFADSKEVSLSWTSADDATNYIIYAGADSASLIAIDTIGTMTDYTVKGLENDQIYYFEVSALIGNGLETKKTNREAAVPVIESGRALVVDQAIQIDSITHSGAFTVEAWIRPQDLATISATNGMGIIQNTNSDNAGDFALTLNTDGSISFFVWDVAGDDPNGKVTSLPNAITENTWAHVAAVWNGSTASLYVNGKVVVTTITNTSTGFGKNYLLGSLSNNGEIFKGEIDELAIWNIAKSNSQIRFSKDVPYVGNELDLLRLYHFDEPLGILEILDGSAYHNNALYGSNTNAVSKAMFPEAVYLTVFPSETTSHVAWGLDEPSDFSHYELYVSDDSVNFLPETGFLVSGFEHQNIEHERPYYYLVIPVDQAGQKGDSAIAMLPYIKVEYPVLDTLKAGEGMQVIINSFDPPPFSVDYKLLISDENGDFTNADTIASTSKDTIGFRVPIGIKSQGSYQLRVVSNYAWGNESKDYQIDPFTINILEVIVSDSNMLVKIDTIDTDQIVEVYVLVGEDKESLLVIDTLMLPVYEFSLQPFPLGVPIVFGMNTLTENGIMTDTIVENIPYIYDLQFTQQELCEDELLDVSFSVAGGNFANSSYEVLFLDQDGIVLRDTIASNSGQINLPTSLMDTTIYQIRIKTIGSIQTISKLSDSLLVYKTPVASISNTDTSICNTDSITLSINPISVGLVYWSSIDQSIIDSSALEVVVSDSVTISLLAENGVCKTDTAHAKISLLKSVTAIILDSANVTCRDAKDAFIELGIVNGDTADYFFNWSHGANTAFISNLDSGVYSVQIQDSLGCVFVDSFQVNQPKDSLYATFSLFGTDSICAGGEVSISIIDTVNVGDAPSVSWFINNNLVTGADSLIFVSNAVKNGDVVYAKLKSNANCISDTVEASFDVMVHELPKLTVLNKKFYRTNIDTLVLKVTPVGGVFSSNDTLLSEFYPSTMLEGIYSFKYNYTDSLTTCTDSIDFDIELISGKAAFVGINPSNMYCQYDEKDTIYALVNPSDYKDSLITFSLPTGIEKINDSTLVIDPVMLLKDDSLVMSFSYKNIFNQLIQVFDTIFIDAIPDPVVLGVENQLCHYSQDLVLSGNEEGHWIGASFLTISSGEKASVVIDSLGSSQSYSFDYKVISKDSSGCYLDSTYSFVYQEAKVITTNLKAEYKLAEKRDTIYFSPKGGVLNQGLVKLDSGYVYLFENKFQGIDTIQYVVTDSISGCSDTLLTLVNLLNSEVSLVGFPNDSVYCSNGVIDTLFFIKGNDVKIIDVYGAQLIGGDSVVLDPIKYKEGKNFIVYSYEVGASILTDSLSFYLDSMPSLSILGVDSMYCAANALDTIYSSIDNDRFTLAWKNTAEQLGDTATIRLQVAGKDTVSVLATSNYGCTAKTSVEFYIKESVFPVIEITGDKEICSNDTAIILIDKILDAGDSSEYYFLQGENRIDADSLEIVGLQSSTKVQAVLVSKDVCALKDTVFSNILDVTVSTSLIPEVTMVLGDSTYCKGDTAVFKVGKISSFIKKPQYFWYVNDQLVGNKSSLRYEVTKSADVYLEVKFHETCSIDSVVRSEINSIDVKEKLLTSLSLISEKDYYCLDEKVTISAKYSNMGENPSIKWYNGGILSDSSSIYSFNIKRDSVTVEAKMMSSLVCVTSADLSKSKVVFKVPDPKPINSQFTIQMNMSNSSTQSVYKYIALTDSIDILKYPTHGASKILNFNQSIYYQPNKNYVGDDMVQFSVKNVCGVRENGVINYQIKKHVTVADISKIYIDTTRKKEITLESILKPYQAINPELVRISLYSNDTLFSNGGYVAIDNEKKLLLVDFKNDSITTYIEVPIQICDMSNVCIQDLLRMDIDLNREIDYIDYDASLLVYNVISPNGDGDNDFVQIDGITEECKNNVTIYNKWGDIIYKTEDYRNEPWDGLDDSGEALPSGTYYYVIDVKQYIQGKNRYTFQGIDQYGNKVKPYNDTNTLYSGFIELRE